MSTSLIQFRAEEALKARSMEICEKLGIDLQTYMRMCLVRLCREDGIPFSMRLDKGKNDLMQSIHALNRQAEAAGVCDMTLDEINAEIAAVRKKNPF